jgi:hypothetical protein
VLSFERIQQYVERKGKGKPEEMEKGIGDKRKTRSSTTEKWTTILKFVPGTYALEPDANCH